MTYNYYSYDSENHWYCKVTKNGIRDYQLSSYFRQYQVEDIHYDYGTKDDHLLQLLEKINWYDSLFISRLNDLGYLVSDVLYNLDRLMDRHIRVFVNGREIDLIITYDCIEYHFNTNYFINFDKYDKVPIFKDDLEGEIIWKEVI